MSRRLAALVVAVGLAGGLVAGCGIPDHTEVQVEAAPQSGSNQKPNVAEPPKKRTDATSVREFVANFLAAPAGEFDVDNTIERLQDYVTGGVTVSLKLGAAVVKVNRIEVARDNRDVKLTVTYLGVLNAEGAVVPSPQATPAGEATYDLRVEPDDAAGGWHLTKVPPGLPLLDVDALTTYYREQPVYFWNTEKTALVPDLRWLPNEVGISRVPTELLKMIEGGPSPAIEAVASALPDGSKLLINAPLDNDQLTMNWSPDAIKNDDDGRLLAEQAAWTVRGVGLRPQKLQLKINGQPKETYDIGPDLLNSVTYPIGPETHAFAILDGKARALGQPAGTPGNLPLAAGVNQNLQWAAFNRTDRDLEAAIVTGAGNNAGLLQVGTAAPDGAVSSVAPLPGAIRPTSTPVWLPRSEMGLVTTDKGLYTFGTSGQPRKITLSGVSGKITAVATAPDGQRIALVADGHVYVVPVAVTQDGLLEPKAPWKLVDPLKDQTAVAWTGETALSVGGTDDDGKLSIVDVTVDGARRNTRVFDARGPITMIAAYPESTVLDRSTTVLYESDSLLFLARGGLSPQLDRSALAGDTAAPSPGTENPSQPMSPFFVY
ncbi:LpqB family beta-propeller domain-containing protein [Asanoa sp. NPDC049573]|uniref:LpqB family beta-propeller domain-containing protein n=1 Tax=Asanoa sp. NPDC049573 TaxID=3155396 RepID=UPI00342E05FA